MSTIRQAWIEFWSKPASPLPLAVLRLGLSACLLVQAYLVAPYYFDLYGLHGILQGALADYVRTSDLPNIASLSHWLVDHGFSETAVLGTAGLAYVASIVCLLLGWHTRVATVAAWLTHLLVAGGHVTSYGVDTFAGVMLFYLMWMPVGSRLSLDAAAGRTCSLPTSWARLSLRVVQLHLCIAYFACGIDKASGIQWWNGDAIWRSVMIPLYAQFDLSWLSHAPWLAKLSCWGTLLVECGYAIFMWVPGMRKPWIAAVIGLHLGILFLMGLTLFALVMIALSTSVFGFSAEVDESGAVQWRKSFSTMGNAACATRSSSSFSITSLR